MPRRLTKDECEARFSLCQEAIDSIRLYQSDCDVYPEEEKQKQWLITLLDREAHYWLDQARERKRYHAYDITQKSENKRRPSSLSSSGR